MTKYLQSIIGRFEELKQGIIINIDKWKALPDTPDSIEIHIQDIKKMDSKIEKVKEELSNIQSEARKLRDEKKTRIEIIEKRATGLHADEKELLELYKIKKK